MLSVIRDPFIPDHLTKHFPHLIIFIFSHCLEHIFYDFTQFSEMFFITIGDKFFNFNDCPLKLFDVIFFSAIQYPTTLTLRFLKIIKKTSFFIKNRGVQNISKYPPLQKLSPLPVNYFVVSSPAQKNRLFRPFEKTSKSDTY